eukprot:c20435_g1_i3 orf=57-569(+)
MIDAALNASILRTVMPTLRNLWGFYNSCKPCAESIGQKIGGFLLLSVTIGLAASTADDMLIFQQCSRKAFKKAEGDQRMQELLGVNMQQGGWQESTIGFAQHGQLVSCSFPVYGGQGTAEIRLKAVRARGDGMWTNFFTRWHWELISIEADVRQLQGGESSLQQLINLNN